MFQSLGRDSVGFSWLAAFVGSANQAMFQSLGRDSVGFSPQQWHVGGRTNVIVSILRSGFCGV